MTTVPKEKSPARHFQRARAQGDYQFADAATLRLRRPTGDRGTDGSNPSPSSGESVSRGISPSHVEKPGFSRGRAGWGRRRGRQRRAWRGDMAPTGGNISVGPYSSTAVLPMWFAT